MIKENENRLPKTGASSSTSDEDKQSHDHLEERETREQTPTESERSLTHDERELNMAGFRPLQSTPSYCAKAKRNSTVRRHRCGGQVSRRASGFQLQFLQKPPLGPIWLLTFPTLR